MLHIYSGSNVGGGEAASETKYAGTANGAQNFQISPFFLSRQNSCPILTQPQQNDLEQELIKLYGNVGAVTKTICKTV